MAVSAGACRARSAGSARAGGRPRPALLEPNRHRRPRPQDAAALPAGAEAVESHVPGSVWKVEVQPGQAVKRGQTLLVVESMKMEITVEAPSDGVVTELLVAEGHSVAPGQRVAVLKSEVAS